MTDDAFDDLLPQLVTNATEAAEEDAAAEPEAPPPAEAETKAEKPKAKAEPAKTEAEAKKEEPDPPAESKPVDPKAKRRRVVDLDHEAAEMRRAEKRVKDREAAASAKEAQLSDREASLKASATQIRDHLALGEELEKNAYDAVVKAARARGLDPGTVLRNIIERTAQGGTPGGAEQADIAAQLRAEAKAEVDKLRAEFAQREQRADEEREKECIRELLDIPQSDDGKVEFRHMAAMKTERLVTEVADALAAFKAKNPAGYRDIIKNPRKLARMIEKEQRDEFSYTQQQLTGESPPAGQPGNGDPQAKPASGATPAKNASSTTDAAKGGNRGVSKAAMDAAIEDELRRMTGLDLA